MASGLRPGVVQGCWHFRVFASLVFSVVQGLFVGRV